MGWGVKSEDRNPGKKRRGKEALRGDREGGSEPGKPRENGAERWRGDREGQMWRRSSEGGHCPYNLAV